MVGVPRKQLPSLFPVPLLVFAFRDYIVMPEGESQPLGLPCGLACLHFLMTEFRRPASQMPVNPGHI